MERLRRDLRGDIETVVRKALAGEPGERYASAGYLAGDLRPSWLLLAGEVPGVLDAQGRVVAAITRQNYDEVAAALGGSRGTDVTGGMVSKVQSMLRLVDEHPQLSIRIFSGLEAGLMAALLREPETAVGTRIA